MLEVDSKLMIPDREIEFSVTTSRGPGGQNVNRVRTRVRLSFDVRNSPSLSEDQRDRIREHLGNRINKDGWLTVESERHRTQLANRKAARERLARLLAGALKEVAPRRKSHAPRVTRERRLEEKRRRSQLKQERARPERED